MPTPREVRNDVPYSFHERQPDSDKFSDATQPINTPGAVPRHAMGSSLVLSANRIFVYAIRIAHTLRKMRHSFAVSLNLCPLESVSMLVLRSRIAPATFARPKPAAHHYLSALYHSFLSHVTGEPEVSQKSLTH